MQAMEVTQDIIPKHTQKREGKKNCRETNDLYIQSKCYFVERHFVSSAGVAVAAGTLQSLAEFAFGQEYKAFAANTQARDTRERADLQLAVRHREHLYMCTWDSAATSARE